MICMCWWQCHFIHLSIYLFHSVSFSWLVRHFILINSQFTYHRALLRIRTRKNQKNRWVADLPTPLECYLMGSACLYVHVTPQSQTYQHDGCWWSGAYFSPGHLQPSRWHKRAACQYYTSVMFFLLHLTDFSLEKSSNNIHLKLLNHDHLTLKYCGGYSSRLV